MLRYQDALGLAARQPLGIIDLDQLDPGGPLPWLRRIPIELTTDPDWGSYLPDLARLVTRLASGLPSPATAAWAQGLDPRLGKEVAVWRAAYAVPDTDLRPTGPPVDGTGWRYQRDLNRRIGTSPRPLAPVHDWGADLPGQVTDDPTAPALARRLEDLSNTGVDVHELLTTALDQGRPLPAENPADALWWRILAAHTPPPHLATPNPVRHRAPVPIPRVEPPAPPYARPLDRGPGIGR